MQQVRLSEQMRVAAGIGRRGLRARRLSVPRRDRGGGRGVSNYYLCGKCEHYAPKGGDLREQGR
nr:MAG TPA: hypothetical protein [Caudoviricetes sp.]